MQRLRRVGLLNEASQRTPLGEHVSHLPVDVRIGKLLIMSTIFGVVDPIVTIAAALTEKSPFVSPFEHRQEASRIHREAFGTEYSDFLAVFRAFEKWKSTPPSQRARFCGEHFLNGTVLSAIDKAKHKYITLLKDLKFLSAAAGGMERANANANNAQMISAVLAFGICPNICRVLHPAAKYQDTVGGGGGAAEHRGEESACVH